MGLDGLLLSYKAKFTPNPNDAGYLYFKDDRGHGVPCSHEQYNEFVSGYEASLARLHKLMWRWAICFFILLAILFVVVAIKFNHLYPYLETPVVTGIGGVIFMFPLGYLLLKSFEERKRPDIELIDTTGAALGNSGRQRGTLELIDQRMKGVSAMPLVVGLFGACVGLFVATRQYLQDAIVNQYLLLFPLLIVGFSLVLWRRHMAFKQDAHILGQQNVVVSTEQQSAQWKVLPDFKTSEAQPVWLRLNELVVHTCNKEEVRKKILEVEVSGKSFEEDENQDRFKYYFKIREAIGSVEGWFMLMIDWKEAANEYYAQLKAATAGTAQLTLPEAENKFDSIQQPNVLPVAIKELEKHGLIQFFINDLSDTYNIIVVKQSDAEEVKDSLGKLQLDYLINQWT